VADEVLSKDPVAFVQALLDARDKYARIVNDAFNSDKEFHRALKEVSVHAWRAAPSHVGVCVHAMRLHSCSNSLRLQRCLSQILLVGVGSTPFSASFPPAVRAPAILHWRNPATRNPSFRDRCPASTGV
jgi:hypothetical protein